MASSLKLATLITCLSSTTGVYANGVVSDEIEAAGGNSIGLAGGGGAALNDHSSVRVNPAMLASSTRYQVTGTYYWPSYGRDFYQIGVVDGTNKKLTAGVIYTSYGDDFVDPYKVNLSSEEREAALYDSKTKRKITVGLASTFGKIAIGLAGTQVEGHTKEENSFNFIEKKALTVGIGAAALMSKSLRFGASVENLNNTQVVDLAPTIKRAGIAFLMDGGRASLHADYIERQRISSEFETDLSVIDILENGVNTRDESEIIDTKVERKAVLSGTVNVQNMLRLSLGYASEIDSGSRSQLAGGVAIVSEGYTLSYQVSNPYLSGNNLNQAVALSIDLKM
jgi:hypothetical protein